MKQKILNDFGFKQPIPVRYDFMRDFRLSEQKEIDKYF